MLHESAIALRHAAGGLALTALIAVAALTLPATPAAAASGCPECGIIEMWLRAHADECGYQGARLPSICDNDPECLRINRECNAKKAALAECNARCTPERLVEVAEERARDHLRDVLANLEDNGFDPDARRQDPVWCAEQSAALELHDPSRFQGGRIGVVQRQFGSRGVTIRRCDGSTVRAEADTPIYPGDCIETEYTGANLLMATGLESRWFANHQVVRVGQDSTACFPTVLDREEGQTNVSQLISGALRSITFGAPQRSYTLMGRTIAGKRGTDVILHRDAESGAISLLTREGVGEFWDPTTDEAAEIPAGQLLEFDGSEARVAAQTNNVWYAVENDFGLALPPPHSRDGEALPLEVCEFAVGDWNWIGDWPATLSADGTWQAADGTSGAWSCLLKVDGVFMTIGADDGSWRHTMTISPDGMTLFGHDTRGGRVFAARTSEGPPAP